MGRDSAVGLATCYGVGGLGIESQWGRDIPHPSRQAPGPTQPPTQVVYLPGVKRRRRWHPLPYSADVKERVELYLSSFGPSWPVLGWTTLNNAVVIFRLISQSEEETAVVFFRQYSDIHLELHRKQITRREDGALLEENKIIGSVFLVIRRNIRGAFSGRQVWGERW